MTTLARPLTGQDIGRAHHATRAVLERTLAAAGVGFTTWVALNRLGSNGSALTSDALASSLVQGLKIEDDEARAVLQHTLAAGLTERTGPASREIGLTQTGSVIFRQVTAAIAGITERLYGGLPAADLAVAARVLAAVTARADAELI